MRGSGKNLSQDISVRKFERNDSGVQTAYILIVVEEMRSSRSGNGMTGEGGGA